MSELRVWSFDPTSNRLETGDAAVQLTPKAAAVLTCLLERSGEVVARSDILASVWPGLHVTEDLVREYVFDLRQALGDDARDPNADDERCRQPVRQAAQVHERDGENLLHVSDRWLLLLSPIDVRARQARTTPQAPSLLRCRSRAACCWRR